MADEDYGDDDAFYYDDDDYLYVEDDYAIAVSSLFPALQLQPTCPPISSSKNRLPGSGSLHVARFPVSDESRGLGLEVAQTHEHFPFYWERQRNSKTRFTDLPFFSYDVGRTSRNPSPLSRLHGRLR